MDVRFVSILYVVSVDLCRCRQRRSRRGNSIMTGIIGHGDVGDCEDDCNGKHFSKTLAHDHASHFGSSANVLSYQLLEIHTQCCCRKSVHFAGYLRVLASFGNIFCGCHDA